jgi:hypothetical protein
VCCKIILRPAALGATQPLLMDVGGETALEIFGSCGYRVVLMRQDVGIGVAAAPKIRLIQLVCPGLAGERFWLCAGTGVETDSV